MPVIPSHWGVRRNGGLFAQRVETGFPDLPILEVSLRTGVRVRDMENLKRKQMMGQREKYKRAAKGDIAYNMMRLWQGAIGIAPVDGLISPAYVVARPLAGVNGAYYAYLYRTDAYLREVNKYSRGIVSDRNRLYWDGFKQMPALVPPPEEQDRIVAYLRAQDAKIARYVRDKRRLIELLNEQKQNLIHLAVTRGLDPTVRLKPSGVEWLGEVPEHWKVMRIKHVARFNPSRSESDHAKCSGAWVAFVPMESLGTDGRLRNLASVPIEDVWAGYTYFKRGDVVLAKITPCFENGKGGYLSELPTEIGFGTTEFLVMRPQHQRITGAFLARLVGLQKFRELGADMMTGAAGQQRIPMDFVQNFNVPLPALAEQVEIEHRCAEIAAEIGAAVQQVQQTITSVLEYRDRLIVDVVTGQVDVRGWVAEPDEVADVGALPVLAVEDEENPDDEGCEHDDDGYQ